MESKSIKVFVSYSHQDAAYLERESLLGFLSGLTDDGIEFWNDEKLRMGELWDDRIHGEIASSDIALVFVSQVFLNSSYCKKEIAEFLSRGIAILPVMLSACEWQRHEWLRQRQFLPGGGKTIEEHYTEPGDRKRLFLEIRTQIRGQAEKLRLGSSVTSTTSALVSGAGATNPFSHISAIRDPACFIGREAELRRLRRLLEGGSVVVLGEPKIGKSSLLLALARSWEGEVLEPIDFHAIEDVEDFYASLAETLGLESTSKWRAIRAALKSRCALLLLDELDYAPERGFRHDDLVRFRPILNENPGFRLVAAARQQLKEVFPDPGRGSAAFSYLVPLTLGPMPIHEARTVLGHPWAPSAAALSPELVARVLAIAGGHPFKVQRGGHHACEALSEAIDWEAAWLAEVGGML